VANPRPLKPFGFYSDEIRIVQLFVNLANALVFIPGGSKLRTWPRPPDFVTSSQYTGLPQGTACAQTCSSVMQLSNPSYFRATMEMMLLSRGCSVQKVPVSHEAVGACCAANTSSVQCSSCVAISKKTSSHPSPDGLVDRSDSAPYDTVR
jgi:hypothetical protein